MGLSLSDRDSQVIWHPYTSQKYTREPIPIVKGKGAWIFDDKGSQYLDAISSWWVTIHGHAHPYIAERIYQQALELEQVIFAGFTHPPAVELAERLLAILPGNFSKVFYSDNGSTAVEVAVKMAIQFWWNRGEHSRTKILALRNSYHGDTFGAMSVSERGLFTVAFQDKLFDVLFADTPAEGDRITIEGYDADQVEQLLDECACVIYEPLLQGAGGMMMYSSSALNDFLSVCKSHKLICIADEVMTGFGRTGTMFASSTVGHPPDIICMSKGITGGTMALGVTACTPYVHDAFVDADKSKTFYHGHSFTANPLACTAALASLDLFERENTLANIQRIAAAHIDFASRLRSLANVSNVRVCGTVIACEVSDSTSGYTSSIRDVITEQALKQGVYVRPLGNTFYLMPPYCITQTELEKIYEVCLNVIADIK